MMTAEVLSRVARQTPRAPASRRARGGAALAALHHGADRRPEASASVLLLDSDGRRGAHRQMVRPGHDLETPVDPPRRIPPPPRHLFGHPPPDPALVRARA